MTDFVWIEDGPVEYYTNGEIYDSDTLYAFDLDSTLCPRSQIGLAFPSVIDMVQNITKRNTPVVIFTNQSQINANRKEFRARIDWIHANIAKIPVFVAVKPLGRKPYPWMFELLRNNFMPAVVAAKSVFVGDAAGRPDDFSDSDYAFALNTGMQFQTAEMFFTNRDNNKPKLLYDGKRAFAQFSVDDPPPIQIPTIPTMWIMVGMPGCGKSTLSRWIADKVGDTGRYSIISQDTVSKGKPGTRKQVLKLIITHCEINTKHIIVDCTNPHKREELVNIAKKYKYNTIGVYFNLPPDLCIWMAYNRFWKSGGTCNHIPKVAYNMYIKHLIVPRDGEFDTLYVINSIHKSNTDYVFLY
jgi:bifunctional polynucleotide phosphatase/kinase